MRYVCLKCGNSYEGINQPQLYKAVECCTKDSLIEYNEFVKNSTTLIQNGSVKLVTAMKILQNSYYESVGNILNAINDTI